MGIKGFMGRRQFATLLASFGAASVFPFVRAAAFTTEPLIINYYEHFVPVTYKDSDGRMTGAMIDILNHVLGERMGLSLRHKGYPWPRAQIMVKSGQSHALCTTATEERRSYLTFSSEPVIKLNQGILMHKDHPQITRLQEFRRVADTLSLRHANYQDNGWAKMVLEGADVVWRNQTSDVLQFITGRLNHVFVGPYPHLKVLIANNDMYRDLVVHRLDDEPTNSYMFGLRPDFPDCRAILDRFDMEMKQARSEGVVEQAFSRYGV